MEQLLIKIFEIYIQIYSIQILPNGLAMQYLLFATCKIYTVVN